MTVTLEDLLALEALELKLHAILPEQPQLPLGESVGPQRLHLPRLRCRVFRQPAIELREQECIDIATHWISDEDLGPADDYAESFQALAAHHRIDSTVADQMAKATGLRNRIAHGYAMLDPARVHAEAPEGIAGLRRFLEAVAKAAGL